MGLDCPGEDLPFDILTHLLQSFGTELVVHPHHILLDDRTLVQILGCVVGSGADHLHTSFIGPQVGIGPLEGGKERMVDVDHLAAVLCGEIGGKDLHIAGQYNQIYIVLGQQSPDLLLLFLLLSLFDRKVIVRNAELVCDVLEIGMVADDQGNVAPQVAFVLSTQQVEETMAGLGYQDGDPIAIIGEMALPSQMQFVGELGEFILEFLSCGLQIGLVEFDPHVIAFGPGIGVLLAMEDIVAPGVEIPGDGGQQAFSIVTLDEENNFMHMGTDLLDSTWISIQMSLERCNSSRIASKGFQNRFFIYR